MKVLILMLVIAMALLLVGCGEEQEVQRPEEKAQELVSQALSAGQAAGDAPQVEVAADGSEFDPPVRIDQLPAGVWYCDRGTAHYASQEQGDGKCPVCRMSLTKKGV